MLNFLNPRFRHVRARHNLPYAQSDVQGAIPVTSIVIPCTGEDYIEEAKLSALFAERFATAAQEIVIVSDQAAAAFGELPPKTRIVTLEVPHREEAYPYKQIYRSRLIKMQAPLHAQGDGILMIDSDLNLLKMPDIHMKDGHFYSSFRQGKMIAKLAGAPLETIPAYYQHSVRPYLVPAGSARPAHRQPGRVGELAGIQAHRRQARSHTARGGRRARRLPAFRMAKISGRSSSAADL